MSKVGLQLPKVVSTVAKQITNIRSQWAKVSNGMNYELQPLTNSVNGVRNKVTDLYIERQNDEPTFFEPVSQLIETLDDLNNQNFTPTDNSEKSEQKEALKLKAEIEKEIKSTIYNIQKYHQLLTT